VGFDGELIVGHFGAKDVFTQSQGGVMRVAGEPDVTWHIFDLLPNSFTGRNLQFRDRISLLEDIFKDIPESWGVVRVPHKLCYSDEGVKIFHDDCVALGYEGLVLRSPTGIYKYGRSTAKEGDFMRFCDWKRSEAKVIGYTQAETNMNEAVTNELGRTKRSTCKENMVKIESMGSLIVKDLKTGVEFNITVADPTTALAWWADPTLIMNKVVMYKYRETVKIAPRFPQIEKVKELEGVRHPDDMS
jgi:DNA ligase-1